jgi:hypothetical protein
MVRKDAAEKESETEPKASVLILLLFLLRSEATNFGRK